MTSRLVLLALLPITAGFALIQRRRLHAIIGMAVFSLLLASVFFLAHAPDVAITEAAIGAALVTLIYVLAIRKTGRLTIAASEAPGLIAREGERVVGLEWEILERLAESLGLEAVAHFVAYEEIEKTVRGGEADIGAGGLIAAERNARFLRTPGHLPTARFHIAGPEPSDDTNEASFRGEFRDVLDAVRQHAPLSVTLDLARFLALSRYDLDAYRVHRREGDHNYTFVVSTERRDLYERLLDLLERLRESGELEGMIRRYFP